MHLSTTVALLYLASVSNSMDMPDSSSSSSSESMSAMMIPYLHFTGGDYLYFASVAPTSKGAIAGACIALVVLAILERAVAGARGIFAFKLNERRKFSVTQNQNSISAERPMLAKNESEITSTPGSTVQSSPDFTLRPLPSQRQRVMGQLVWPHELARGAMFVVQSFFLYALMLGVMTFNASYIISIIAGSAIGEVLFGRFIVESSH